MCPGHVVKKGQSWVPKPASLNSSQWELSLKHRALRTQKGTGTAGDMQTEKERRRKSQMQEQTKRWREGEDGQRDVTSRPRDVKRLRGCTAPSSTPGSVRGRGDVHTGGGACARAHLDDVGVGAAFVRLVVLRVLEQHLVHVGAGVLEQLVGVIEYDERDLAVAQHTQLVRLLHQPELPLGECHLQVGGGRPGVAQSRPAQESPPAGRWTQPLLREPPCQGDTALSPGVPGLGKK